MSEVNLKIKKGNCKIDWVKAGKNDELAQVHQAVRRRMRKSSKLDWQG